jgi:hypothetical protein
VVSFVLFCFVLFCFSWSPNFSIFVWQIASIVASGIQPLQNLTVLVSMPYLISWHMCFFM